MSVFYTSDLHLGHKLMARLRGFGEGPDAVAAHDAFIAFNWAAVVKPDDIVFVLGDLVVSSLTNALALLSGLPGRKQLILGNHDEGHPMHLDAWKKQKKYLEVFESVQPFARRKVDGVEFLLSHFPYSIDHTADVRYMQWRLRDEGMLLVHGHTHSDKVWTSPRELHVGMDAWGLKLVPEEVVVRLLKEGYEDGV